MNSVRLMYFIYSIFYLIGLSYINNALIYQLVYHYNYVVFELPIFLLAFEAHVFLVLLIQIVTTNDLILIRFFIFLFS